jgi:hypothetical protein
MPTGLRTVTPNRLCPIRLPLMKLAIAGSAARIAM